MIICDRCEAKDAKPVSVLMYHGNEQNVKKTDLCDKCRKEITEKIDALLTKEIPNV